MIGEFDPGRDLRINRVIQAGRARLWKAWTDPAELARWWLPSPMQCRVERLDVVPGGAFVTSMSSDGIDFQAHLDACFLVVEPTRRIMFTNALDSSLRPANPAPVAMTAEITFGDHPLGTDYRIVVRHADAASRAHHEHLGFADGWGTVTEQLATIAETEEEPR